MPSQPKAKKPPEEIDTKIEITYVNQMLCAFSDVIGEAGLTRDDLRKYPEYIADFEEQRQCFYAAETIHEEARDTLRLKDKDGFDLVKREIKGGIKDGWDLARLERPYSCMKKSLHFLCHWGVELIQYIIVLADIYARRNIC